MARKKVKDKGSDKQGSLLADKKKDTPVHDGQKGKEPTMKNPEKTIPTGPVEKPKLYAGLDIDGLIGKFSEVAEEFGAEYESASWSGTGTLRLTVGQDDSVLPFIGAVEKLCKQYNVNASLGGRMNHAVDEPFVQVVITIPGRLVEAKFA